MAIERIDSNKCNGCGICVDTCFVDVIRLDTVVASRNEDPPCRWACPAGVDVRRYVRHLHDDEIELAYGVLKEALPLPGVTGRVCPHFCESDCVRQRVDAAVNINQLERYVADRARHIPERPVPVIYNAKVAIVGAGPGGLSAAYSLRQMGYAITVFEEQGDIGGMLRAAIPEYRLPRDILDVELQGIRAMGVEFVTNTRVGRDIELGELRARGYSAVILAIGAQASRELDVPGVRAKDMMMGLDFLKACNSDPAFSLEGAKVAVIGGGNVAVDAAMTARRRGAAIVRMVCLEKYEDMPSFETERQLAQAEGIEMMCGWAPGRFGVAKGGLSGLHVKKCVSVFDHNHLFAPKYDESVTDWMPADLVIAAIGQSVDKGVDTEGALQYANGVIKVEGSSLMTSQAGVFAVGDAIRGPASVVEAFADGKLAALSVDAYLRGVDVDVHAHSRRGSVGNPPTLGIQPRTRREAETRCFADDGDSLAELKLGFDADQMRLEVERCMTCGSRAIIKYADDCMLCQWCERECPQGAIYVSPDKSRQLMTPWE